MAQDNNSPINKARQEVKKKVEAARVAAIKRKGDNQLKKISSSIKEEYHQLIVKYLEGGKTKSRRESASAKSRLDAIAKIKSRYRGKEITEIQEALGRSYRPWRSRVKGPALSSKPQKKLPFTLSTTTDKEHKPKYQRDVEAAIDKEDDPRYMREGKDYSKALDRLARSEARDGKKIRPEDVKKKIKKHLKEGSDLTSRTASKDEKRLAALKLTKSNAPHMSGYNKKIDDEMEKLEKKKLKEDQEKTCGLWGTKRAALIAKLRTPGESKTMNEAAKWRPGMSKKELAALKTSAKVVADKRKASKAKTLSSPKPAPAPAKEPETGGSRLDWFNKQPELQRWLRANVHPADRERVMDHIWNSPSGKAFDTVAKYKSGEHKYRKPPKPGP